MNSTRLEIVAVLLALATAGCAQKARRVEPVSIAKVEAQHALATKGIATAKVHNQTASEAIGAARGSLGRARMGIDYQLTALDAIRPHVEILMRNVPPELRAEVEAVQQQVATLTDRTAEVAQANADAEQSAAAATAAQSAVGTALEQTNAAVNEAKSELAEVSEANAAAVAQANLNADLADTAQKRVRELERKNWIRRALEALAAIALLVGGIFWFTGKLTFTGLRTARAVADAVS